MEPIQKMKTAGIVIWLAGAIFCVAQRPSPPNIRSISPAELVSVFDQSNDAIRSNLALPQFGAFVVTNEIRYPLNAQPYARDSLLHVVLTNGPAIRITYLTNDNKLGFQEIGPELPSGTPVDGTTITTFDRRLVPCFAAINPPCPGHWTTNFTSWVFKDGQWNMRLETNSVVMTGLHPQPTTNWVKVPYTTTNNHIWYEYRIIELGLVSDGRVVWR